MLRFLRSLYAFWAFLCFIAYFVLIFPLFWLIIQNRKWHWWVGRLNRLWAFFFYSSIGVPIRRVFPDHFDKKKQYIFCANHNSYLDIPVLGANVPQHYRFLGKSSLTKIPLFGYMFSHLHIAVDRTRKKESYRSFELAKAAIDEGFSILIFPEGGINDQNPPGLKRFKEGAFRIAIEKQIPIVPVTIPYNWIVLWDESFQMRWQPAEVVFHEPIETQNMTLGQMDALKEQTRSVILAEMQRRFPAHFTEKEIESENAKR